MSNPHVHPTIAAALTPFAPKSTAAEIAAWNRGTREGDAERKNIAAQMERAVLADDQRRRERGW